MHKRIAKALLESVFYRVSAVVSLDENKRVLSVSMFSTDWPEGHLYLKGNEKEIWLISNHPEGSRTPSEQDRHNYWGISSMAASVPVRLFLTSEYFECFEAEDMQQMEKGLPDQTLTTPDVFDCFQTLKDQITNCSI